MKKLKQLSWVLAGSFLPAVASAAGLVAPTKPIGVPGNSGDTASQVIVFYVNILLGIVGVVAVAFLIYGGFRYITSAGNEETAGEAKRIILNSIIGLVVIILSYTIITVIINAIGKGNV